ncbi:MAG: flippase-like domain-containing protein [Candidatus Omnitrophica bacterium]|nr:flippase-like domain-containing protein [Candidatus Omnitrophota bacterium]
MTPRWKTALTLLLRTGITLFAFWWIFRKVDAAEVRQTLGSADRFWLVMTVGVFFASQAGCILRWRFLVPAHPGLKLPMLANSFFVGSFFNTFLPTTVGGDVIRGYDLIKITGEWRGALASILVDRLLGLVGFLSFALAAWVALPTAREDPMIRATFIGFCLLVAVTFSVLGSRRLLRTLLRPFGKIGLGQLQSHAKQFQETLRDYVLHPARLLKALAVTLTIQVLAILLYAAAAKALRMPVPLMYLILVVPMIMTISQVPVSLNGWGIREWATVLFLGRIGVSGHEAISLSLICALIPLLSGVIGAALFLGRQRRKKPAPA